ncbi:MAG: hypothetical protein M3P40_09395 [Actinomycetota bacterium]|nr:hypothetical protein [Actinomycetota bacterium]
MSFFEDDEPRTTPVRPRRAAGTPAAGAGALDPSAVRRRRAIFAVVVVLLLILLALLLRGCLDTRSDNALKDYNREMKTIVEDSDVQVGEQFFQLLSDDTTESAQDLQTGISAYRVSAQQQLERARDMDVPADVRDAHQSALIALELRRDGLSAIAEEIRPALGDEGETADTAIAGIAQQMGAFLASDVLWQSRVTPLVRDAFKREEITGERAATTSNFLEGTEWLDPETVAERLGQNLTDGETEDGEAAPGLHGTGIDAVSAGTLTLQPGDVVNRIPADTESFIVTFTNQGENDEADVQVTLTIEGTEGDPIRAVRTIDTVARGQTVPASLSVDETLPTQQAVTITAEVKPVRGEQKTDNNKLVFQALFTP